MEVFYKRSMDNSYMVIGGTDISTEETYQSRMLAENRIPGLLPCKIQKLNGDKLFYYEITGCQSLQNLFEKRKFGRQELEDLFISVLRMMECLDEYLMNRDFLLLQPSCIFQNNENNTYSFVWIPVRQGKMELEFRQLTEYILPKIDHTDQEAVTLGYRVYKESVEPNIRMELLKKQIYLQKEEELVQERRILKHEEEQEEERQRILDDFYKDEEEETGYGILEKIGMVLFFVFVVLIWFLVGNLRMFQSVPMRILLAGGLSAVCLVVGIFYWIWQKRVGEKTKKKKEEKQEEPIVRKDNPKEFWRQERKETAGATVLLQENRTGEAYLEELDAENPQKFFLTKEMIMIGKWKENVDLWLDVPTVSRLHAKIISRGQKHILIDINSRNGTMLNNSWIDPEQEYVLENGDVIVFAQKRFRYVF